MLVQTKVKKDYILLVVPIFEVGRLQNTIQTYVSIMLLYYFYSFHQKNTKTYNFGISTSQMLL